MRNKKELNSSLKGTTLGDADADTDDTLKWIKKAKKREKELAKKRQAELESMDKMFQGDEYTESESSRRCPVFCMTLIEHSGYFIEDLEGLKVSHDFEDMDEGEARILTLKDSRILDNEGKVRFSEPCR